MDYTSGDEKMKIVAPDYYKDFACIAGACRHSCCLGWEIDIDKDTLDYYRSIPGEMGKRLSEHIAETDEGACFRLTENERCPFLNSENLCDLIIELGEESLCQICDDHPRFRNFWADRTEIGLGLCCEAAGKLILTREKTVELAVIEDDGEADDLPEEEAEILEFRDELIAIIQNRELSMAERVERLLEAAEMDFPALSCEDWAEFLLSLERLDEAWTMCLERLRDAGHLSFDRLNTPEFEIAFEQLMVYLLYRHVPAALEDDDLPGHIAFAVFAWYLMRWLCAGHPEELTMEDIIEYARLYSSEIEYSDENIQAIIEELYR